MKKIDKSEWATKSPIKSTQRIIVGDCIEEIRKFLLQKWKDRYRDLYYRRTPCFVRKSEKCGCTLPLSYNFLWRLKSIRIIPRYL